MSSILLIEPNSLLAEQYRGYLSGQGHEVNWVRDGQEAINRADETKPEAIVMEIALTAHSGIEFLHELRSYAEWRDIPVIILSRLSEHDVNQSGKELSGLGVVKYLYKPDTSLRRLGDRIMSVSAKKPSK